MPDRKPILLATTKHHWIDGEKIPAEGGCLLVLNHISQVDPLIAAHIVWDHGRIPRYLAKAGLFKNKVLGFFLTLGRPDPGRPRVEGRRRCLRRRGRRGPGGKCVVVYPEGTITRDPDLWPMVGKSGAARIALATGAPVIPIGQWGAQELLAPYAKKPDLFPRKLITMKVGDPVDLSDLQGKTATTAVDRRGDRPDHGRAHRAGRGRARRDRAGRAVRPAHRRRLGDRQPQRGRTEGQGRA